MSLECPSCDQEIEEFSRTGDKRYACNHCARVIKYDTVEQHLDEIPVNDKRDDVGSNTPDKEEEPEPEPEPDQTSSESQENPVSNNDAERNEREVIREEGYEGLRRIKERKLKEWLATTDGVGAKTESRILKVFREESMYSEEPSTLYNLLDDELSASPSYINTIVNSVFSPEYEHEDLLQQQGYTPFFRNGGQSNQGGRNNMNGGFNGRNGGNQGGGRQNPGQQQSQGGGGGGGMTREEAVEMIRASSDSNDQGSRRRGPGTEALDEATEQAIKNMADNMGGFFGMLQRVGEEALVQYFKQNPEKLVENMTLLNAFMNEAEDLDDAPNTSEQDQKVDDAIEQAMGGGGSSSEPVDNFGESRDTFSGDTDSFSTTDTANDPMSAAPEEHTESDSGFEMDTDAMEGGGPNPSTPERQQDTSTRGNNDPHTSDDRNNSSGTDSSSNDNQKEAREVPAGGHGPEGDGGEGESSLDDKQESGGQTDEDEEWDELFGDLED